MTCCTGTKSSTGQPITQRVSRLVRFESGERSLSDVFSLKDNSVRVVNSESGETSVILLKSRFRNSSLLSFDKVFASPVRLLMLQPGMDRRSRLVSPDSGEKSLIFW